MFGIGKLLKRYKLYKKADHIWEAFKGADMSKLKSRKLWVLVAAAALIFVNDYLGQPVKPEALDDFIKTVLAYLGGQSVVDAFKEWKKKE